MRFVSSSNQFNKIFAVPFTIDSNCLVNSLAKHNGRSGARKSINSNVEYNRCVDSYKMTVCNRDNACAQRSRRSSPFAGKKPINSNYSVDNPDTTNPAIAAHTPTMGTTLQ